MVDKVLRYTLLCVCYVAAWYVLISAYQCLENKSLFWSPHHFTKFGHEDFTQVAYGVSAQALTPFPGNLNHCRSCTPASEDGLREIPKYVIAEVNRK
jgi:hypothetical protein